MDQVMSMKYYSRLIKCLTVTSIAALLVACGGGGGDESASTGSLSLSVADAPVDMADEVVVEFTGVELQHSGGDRIMFDFTTEPDGPCVVDPTACQIDLLALTDGASEFLLKDEVVPSGKYSWARLLVKAELGVRDTYIVVGGMEYEMIIPSGAKSGLKLNRGFVVPAGGEADFTIDFDLRKSVNNPEGLTYMGADVYKLRPTLRTVDNAEVGVLMGNVDSALITDGCSGAVYVFNAGATPDDEDGDDGDPITSGLLKDDYSYKVPYLAEGEYLAAFTCDAEIDLAGTDEAVVFSSEAPVTITAGQNTTQNFPPTP
jgi:hypothetical protein